ncbi:MAG TPA: 4-(cytidine 5'-diphospho)-2-C-methyl-D-erythritol kinase [Halomicronema sp.]
MQSYTLLAPAKINLYLEIIGLRSDGYHELAMVMQTVDLADKIVLRPNGNETFRLSCDHPEVPTDHTNLASKAAQLMVREFPKSFANYGGADIHIHKNIPVAAGLAGGSSNGAAVLVGLNLIWQLGLTHSELEELAGQLGSDVPFCISGGTALATGRGNELDTLPLLNNLYVVLAKYENLSVPTPWAYKTYKDQFSHTYITDTATLESRCKRVHSGPIVSAIAHQDNPKIGELLHNDLEKVVLPAYPQVEELRQAFLNEKNNNPEEILGAMMSGSGPTVFAITNTLTQAEKLKEKIKTTLPNPDLKLWVAKFISSGITITADS